MLQLDHTGIAFAEREWEFDLTLATHGVHALLGRSGSGKSTLLNLIAGFMRPDSGDIRWQGQSLLPMQPSLRPVTSLFQQQNLFSHLTVRQNTGLGIDPGLKLSAAQIQSIQSVLIDVGLEGMEHKLPGMLSGGEQQRVALARCLLRRRPLLLLDEPFSALDATTRQEMITLTRTVIAQYKPCVIMVTHDEEDAVAMQASILRIQDGRINHEAG
ncbi:ATP-binding cassette domain-containing protein [Granulosicoccus antarcticus]|uniref:Thiamine import ATP-binding protein ThiQ n=1 Tax=Granulosicoccus antarcticus IMCC3135 TaxID=1192854 RepID=A0A2Z2P110_9GAMM|nr:ATP-binding cassette domain-containing protein [Granulosicoccus antarcticus]ASJ76485.1 Thiamine import ATP-binding protein ThiQ [Granulosicoccus antarcticus IMCC3135]